MCELDRGTGSAIGVFGTHWASGSNQWLFFFFSYNAQHQQADDIGIWGAHAEGVICGKIGKYVE